MRTVLLLIALTIALIAYGALMKRTARRNFNNIPQSYPAIAIDIDNGEAAPHRTGTMDI